MDLKKMMDAEKVFLFGYEAGFKDGVVVTKKCI